MNSTSSCSCDSTLSTASTPPRRQHTNQVAPHIRRRPSARHRGRRTPTRRRRESASRAAGVPDPQLHDLRQPDPCRFVRASALRAASTSTLTTLPPVAAPHPQARSSSTRSTSPARGSPWPRPRGSARQAARPSAARHSGTAPAGPPAPDRERGSARTAGPRTAGRLILHRPNVCRRRAASGRPDAPLWSQPMRNRLSLIEFPADDPDRALSLLVRPARHQPRAADRGPGRRAGRPAGRVPLSVCTAAAPAPETRSRSRTSRSPISTPRSSESRSSAEPSCIPARSGRSARTPRELRSAWRAAASPTHQVEMTLRRRLALTVALIATADRRTGSPSRSTRAPHAFRQPARRQDCLLLGRQPARHPKRPLRAALQRRDIQP